MQLGGNRMNGDTAFDHGFEKPVLFRRPQTIGILGHRGYFPFAFGTRRVVCRVP